MKFDPDAAASEHSGIYGLPFKPAEAKVVIIPVPFEATTSYGGGTSRGPQAVLEASKQVDLFDHETGRPYEAGIAMLDIPLGLAITVEVWAVEVTVRQCVEEPPWPKKRKRLSSAER